MTNIETYNENSSTESPLSEKSSLSDSTVVPEELNRENVTQESENEKVEIMTDEQEDTGLEQSNNSGSTPQNAIRRAEIRERIVKRFSDQDRRIQEFQSLKKEIPDFSQVEKAFYEISPNTLFFDVKLKEKFLKIIRKKFQNLKQVLPEISADEFWNETEIDNMFGKGFNPTSLVTSAESCEWFKSNLEVDEEKPIIISELGPGAGWSTTMLFNEIKSNNPDKKIYLYAIDKSPHSIATTQALLEYYGIKHLLIKNDSDRSQINELIEHGELDSCVILNLGHANTVLEKYPDNFFQGFYSTHGTAYFSEREYKEFLNVVRKKGKDKAILIADSLNPNYVNHLSKMYLLPQMLFPKAMKRHLDKKGITYLFEEERLPNASKYYEETIVIKAFNEHRADLILKWSNYLIKNLKLSRMIKTIQSLSVTMDVVERYRCDVYPSTKLREIVDPKDFEEITNDRPDFTIFLETIGFRINK